MQGTIFPNTRAAAKTHAHTAEAQSTTSDTWTGLSRDVIERFLDVIRCTTDMSRERWCGYRADLCSLESWMQGTTGHTMMTASATELRVYFRKVIGTGVEPRLLERLLASMQQFYAYSLEAGFRADNPATCMPHWVQNHITPATESSHATPVYAHG